MKHLVLAFLLSIIISGCTRKDVYVFSYFKGNGEDGLHLAVSEDGFKWTALNNDSSFLKPELSKDKLMRDPCIIKGGDGLYHMVWTVSWQEKGIGYASSPDLLNWSQQKMINVLSEVDGVRNCWAPEITYDPVGNEYMIYWASTIDGRFTETLEQEEGGLSHRIYAITTKDFKVFTEAELLYDYGFNVIDASIIFHDGKYIMFLKDETLNPPQKNIRIAWADKMTGPYSAPSVPITGNYWAEGPTALFKDGKCIVYFDKYMEGKYGAVCSEDLVHWKDISDKVSFPEGTRHGTVFAVDAASLDFL